MMACNMKQIKTTRSFFFAANNQKQKRKRINCSIYAIGHILMEIIWSGLSKSWHRTAIEKERWKSHFKWQLTNSINEWIWYQLLFSHQLPSIIDCIERKSMYCDKFQWWLIAKSITAFKPYMKSVAFNVIFFIFVMSVLLAQSHHMPIESICLFFFMHNCVIWMKR